MRTYSDEFKAAILERLLPPHAVAVSELARETRIPKDTLYMWRSQARRAQGLAVPIPAPAPERWSGEAKLAVVVESAALTEVELSAYCRQRGLYIEQLQEWRKACVQANAPGAVEGASERQRGQAQAKRIKQLEAELRYKEKALAEAAALLVLQKKVQALWGESEGGQ